MMAVSVLPLYVTDNPSIPKPKLLIKPNNIFATSCADGSTGAACGVAGAACGSAGAVFFLPIPLIKSKRPIIISSVIIDVTSSK